MTTILERIEKGKLKAKEVINSLKTRAMLEKEQEAAYYEALKASADEAVKILSSDQYPKAKRYWQEAINTYRKELNLACSKGLVAESAKLVGKIEQLENEINYPQKCIDELKAHKRDNEPN